MTPSRASIYREALAEVEAALIAAHKDCDAAALSYGRGEPGLPREFLGAEAKGIRHAIDVCRAIPIPEEKDEGCNFDNLCDDCRRAMAQRVEENPDER